MKKVFISFFAIFLFACNIDALQICTPSDEYLEYMLLSDEEKKDYIEPVYCKELMNKNESFLVSLSKTVTNTLSASSLDSSYNAVNDGLLTTPGNQGDLGTCWAFSSLSAVEANARKNNVGSYNLSEEHLIYSVLSSGYSDSIGQKGKYYTSNFDGGKVTYAASYFFNNTGQLLENDWPYNDTYQKINSSQYKQGRKLISLGGFNLTNISSYSKCSESEIAYIKKQIATYGSVQSSMYMSENLFKDTDKNYYISTKSNSSNPNHGISIVGWNDNVSSTKFNASRNGAFIVKNSWGPSWSGDGYFYISYDDHFICKNTASFYDVSNKTFEYTYAASDMVGSPTFMISEPLYISSKFTKKTSGSENLGRVSFAVAENAKYSVYLVADNKLTSTSSWQLLTSATSDTYGIKSVDLTNKTINSDFTIVVKYEPNESTSFFTMCTNTPDTSKMTISSGTNYFATTLSNWTDMKSITTQNGTISCEPNIYAYTDSINQSQNQSITITSISSSNDKYTISFNNNNVNTGSISYLITDSNNANVTFHFTIVPNYTTNKVVVSSDGTMSGRFNFIIRYNGNDVKTTFTLTESVSVKDSSFMSISGNNIIVNIQNNYTLTYQKLMDGLNIKNTSVQVLNAKGNEITSSSSTIPTNTVLKVNSKTYTIVVLGDVNCDGKISALDYIEVRMHIMGTKITNSGKLKASDIDKNGSINALDYIAIRMILMR